MKELRSRSKEEILPSEQQKAHGAEELEASLVDVIEKLGAWCRLGEVQDRIVVVEEAKPQDRQQRPNRFGSTARAWGLYSRPTPVPAAVITR